MQELSLNKIQQEIPQIRYRRPNYQIPILNRISNEIKSIQFPNKTIFQNKLNEHKQIKPLKFIPYTPISLQQIKQIPYKYSKRITSKKISEQDHLDFESSSRQLQLFLEQEKNQLKSEKYIQALLECVRMPSINTEIYKNNKQTIDSLLQSQIGSSVRMNTLKPLLFNRKRSKSYDIFDKNSQQNYDSLDLQQHQIL
ncbi:unnamed protein product [Paramecium sonneborni]|uniref:Uncharacterized protein n=1 Tax=Paramecium sonneborni TaxID=65129 RepID=A0A8S1KNV0_9CILI|nr:unnamed protein product [Paramecium sonneborni]